MVISTNLYSQNIQLNFDGNDIVTIPNGLELLSNKGTYTVELWARSNIANTYSFLASIDHSTYFFVNYKGRLGWGFDFGDELWSDSCSFRFNNEWQHIAFIRSEGDTGKIYVNGERMPICYYAYWLHTNPIGDLLFGQKGFSGQYFRGSLDEVRIWDYERTQTQIQNHMDDELIGNETGLIGYWKFNEVIEQQVFDSQDHFSIKNHNGTLGADRSIGDDDPNRVVDPSLPLNVKETNMPQNPILVQNYPNPFNLSTGISYIIPRSDFVILKVYDVLGRDIRILVNEYQAAGIYYYSFSGGDFATGAYFYQLKVGDYFLKSKRMILIK